MNKEGGAPTQLTVHSANEYPGNIQRQRPCPLFSFYPAGCKRQQFPSSLFAQIYQVGTQGGRPELFSSLAMENLSFSKNGKQVLYNDFKGYEDPWRKHHQSSITRDIWLCTLDNDRTFKKITSFRGEDRDPVGRRTEMPFTI